MRGLSNQIDKNGCDHACTERYAHTDGAVLTWVPHEDAVRPGFTASAACSVRTPDGAAGREEEGSRHHPYQCGYELSHPDPFLVASQVLGRIPSELVPALDSLGGDRRQVCSLRVTRGDLLARADGAHLARAGRQQRRRSGSAFGESASQLAALDRSRRRPGPAIVRRTCGGVGGDAGPRCRPVRRGAAESSSGLFPAGLLGG